jgi:transcriptional regulator with XRE-family HTH domain
MIADLIRSIESRAALAGLRMSDVLTAASVDYATWWRWKRGKTSPNLATVQRVEAVLNTQTDLPK